MGGASIRRAGDDASGAPRLWPWPAFAVLLLAGPLLFPSDQAIGMLIQIGIAAIACLSYNILLGQGGMLSFGHAVYSGAGAFLAMHALRLSGGGWPLPTVLVPLAGGIAGMLLALLLGWVTTRKSGTSFAMITLGMGELAWASALMFPEVFGGEGGLSGDRSAGLRLWGLDLGPQRSLYYLVAAYVFAGTALMYAFTRSMLGRLLNAVRDNALRTGFLGYDPRRIRYLGFVVAAFFAGIAGGLGALHYEIVTAEVFSAQRSGGFLLFTFLGGVGLFVGPLVGAVLMVLATVLLSEFTRAWLLYLGLAFLCMVRWAPNGLAGLALSHWRVVLSGRVRGALAAAYLCLLAAMLLALAGIGALVEMAYQRQLDAVLGTRLSFMGIGLDTALAHHWVAAFATGAVGTVLTVLARHRLARDWSAVHDGAGTAPQASGPG